MDEVDCVVIGAGVIGLAVARALALRGREVLVLDAHHTIGMETSSRNSEVIHAGLYYPTGSLKARTCVAGRERLYAYCVERGIPHQRCGKLIVATSDAQRDKLVAIHAQAQANGCTEVIALTVHEAKALEPNLSCVAALFSPATGIIDSHAYMQALQGDAQNAGAVFAFNSCVVEGEHNADGIVLRVRPSLIPPFEKGGLGGISTSDRVKNPFQSTTDYEEYEEGFELQANIVINCAGLWAPRVANQIDGLDKRTIPTAYFAKGNYYSLTGKAPFSHLVYPVPEPGGLGVHLTLDLAGQARFGPDVEWLDDTLIPPFPKGGLGGILDEQLHKMDYMVDPQRADQFYPEIRAYWPGLPNGALEPAYAGIRPKISPAHAAAADFLIASHGSSYYVGLYGIESPGLTASMAIAESVISLV